MAWKAQIGKQIGCDVLAWGTAEADVGELPALRQRPHPADPGAVPANLLKHADDQTVAGMAALFRAVHRFGLNRDAFRDWGVVAAPRFLGRAATAATLHKFAIEGAWGVFPHLVPNRSLHSVSGTVSQALAIHGPNFGVGGGPGAESEALLAAAALLQDPALPAVWVVMTAWHPEPIPECDGRVNPPAVCRAAALALAAPRLDWKGSRMRLVPAPEKTIGSLGTGCPLSRQNAAISAGMSAALSADNPLPSTWVWMLECGGRVELEQVEIVENMR